MTSATLRPTVPALETYLGRAQPILDHGFLRLIDYMGDDAAIVQAARVSYGVGTKSTSEDSGLIRYLMRHRHTTPFEMCEIKFHIKMPIFVARQWVRHRMANINEYSARYSILDREFYIPEPEVLAEQSTINKQGRTEKGVTSEQAEYIRHLLVTDANHNYDSYLHLLNEKMDADNEYTLRGFDENRPQLARELARMNLTLNTYTQWYWKTDLHNLFHFLGLRADPHAQYEIRVYADAILGICKDWVPHATQAFLDYRLNAYTLSAQQLELVKHLIGDPTQIDAGHVVTLAAQYNLSARERDELLAKLT